MNNAETRMRKLNSELRQAEVDLDTATSALIQYDAKKIVRPGSCVWCEIMSDRHDRTERTYFVRRDSNGYVLPQFVRMVSIPPDNPIKTPTCLDCFLYLLKTNVELFFDCLPCAYGDDAPLEHEPFARFQIETAKQFYAEFDVWWAQSGKFFDFWCAARNKLHRFMNLKPRKKGMPSLNPNGRRGRSQLFHSSKKTLI